MQNQDRIYRMNRIYPTREVEDKLFLGDRYYNRNGVNSGGFSTLWPTRIKWQNVITFSFAISLFWLHRIRYHRPRTNVLQVRPISECPLSCIFCSNWRWSLFTAKDIGIYGRSCALIEGFEWAASYKEIYDIEAHIDTVGEPSMYPQLVELVGRLSEK